jgi:hypothetical protein
MPNPPKVLPPGALVVARVLQGVHPRRGPIVTYICTHDVDRSEWKVHRAEATASTCVGDQLVLNLTTDVVEPGDDA